LYVKVPREEVVHRLERFQEELVKIGLDAALITHNADLLYLTGTIQQAQLWVPAQGQPLLLVKKNLARARDDSPLDRIFPLSGLAEMPGILKEFGLFPAGRFRLGLELDVLPAKFYLRYQHLFPTVQVEDISPVLRQIRAVKSEFELDMMRKAGEMADALFQAAQEILVEGMSEVELAGLVEAVVRKAGHQALVRVRSYGAELVWGHLLSGPPAVQPSLFDSPTGGIGVSPAMPHGSGFRKIGRREPVILDYPGVYNGYILEQTRILSLGSLPPHLEDAYQVSREILAYLEQEVRAGMTWGEVDLLARRKAEKSHFAANFLGFDGYRVPFVGHGVGLELDELPVLAAGLEKPLLSGMTVAIEPKFLFPDEGVVGLENTYVVRENGLESLMTSSEELVFL